MNRITKALIGLTTAVALVAPVSASVINVGGVTWDPDATSPLVDFSGSLDFDQWFQNTATNTAADLNFGDAVALTGPTAFVGKWLGGTGYVTGFNGVDQQLPPPHTTPEQFCPGCELTFAFGGIQLTNINFFDLGGGNFIPLYTFDITNSWATFYVDNTPDYPTGTRPDVASAIDGKEWLNLAFSSFSLQGGVNVIGGHLDAQLSVTTGSGLANENFDTDPTTIGITPLLSGADLLYSANSIFDAGAKSANGTGTAKGNTIPEPTTLMLLGTGLIGLSAPKFRKKKGEKTA
jgi:hypothetical protein